MEKSKKYFIVTAALFALFIVFTVMVSTIDVKILENGSVGFSALNEGVHKAIGENSACYHITQILGIVAIFEMGCFAAIGLYQLIKRKSLIKVEGVILALGITYILLFASYIFFEIFVINYRPATVSGVSPEASYPSSHTMLSVTVFITGIFAIKNIVKNKKIVLPFAILSALLAAFTVVCRFISGVHWLTDIIAGILLGAALFFFFRALSEVFENLKDKSKKQKTVGAEAPTK